MFVKVKFTMAVIVNVMIVDDSCGREMLFRHVRKDWIKIIKAPAVNHLIV